MQEYMRICPICAKEKDRSFFKSNSYVPGWFDFWDNEPPEEITCDFHQNQELIKSSISCEEFQILRYISNEPSFMQAMNDLKEKDLIEYNLKLSQFKIQVQQIEQEKSNNTPKCPTCNSTDIKKISGTSKAVSVAMWGLLSRKVHKQWHCNNCGSEW